MKSSNVSKLSSIIVKTINETTINWRWTEVDAGSCSHCYVMHVGNIRDGILSFLHCFDHGCPGRLSGYKRLTVASFSKVSLCIKDVASLSRISGRNVSRLNRVHNV